MTVRVQLFSQLRDAAGVSELQIEVAEGATVGDLLKALYALKPRLREWDNSVLVGSGVEFVQRAHLLRSEDEIAIMPPVQGG